MILTETNEYKELHNIITEHLEKDERDYTIVPEYKRSKFVVDLCKDVHDYIKTKNDDVTLEQVFSVDIFSSGHVDYHRKFALHCYDLIKYGNTSYI